MAFTQDAGCRFAGRSHCLYRINVHVSLPGPGRQMPVRQIKSLEYFCVRIQDAGCRFAGRSNCLYRINVYVPLSRMPDAGSPDKFIGIFLCLLLRTPDAGSPADPIVFTASMFMFLYPGRQMPVRWIKSLEYFCVFFSGRRIPVRQQIRLSLQNQCSCSFILDARCQFAG